MRTLPSPDYIIGWNRAQGHIFRTNNAGATGTDISENLPNLPVNDLVARVKCFQMFQRVARHCR